MKILKNWLLEAFGFSKTEMNGTWLLLILIILMALVPRIYFQNKYRNQTIQPSDQAEINAWVQRVESAFAQKREEKPQWKKYKDFTKESIAEVKPEFSTKKYKNKTNTNAKPDYPSKYAKNEPVYTSTHRLELNKATIEDLQKIKGIGPKLSERIVKYRDYLGGFANSDQLQEVYGLQPELIDELKEITSTEGMIRMIYVNTDSLKYLASHPYIDYKLARSIINYRKVHGDYQDAEGLRQLKLLPDSLYQKLYPYISVSDQPQ